MADNASSRAAMPLPPHVPPLMPAHLPALDGLRGIAVLLVLVHMFSLFEGNAGLFSYVHAKVTNVGWVGVQLFFVLSGFLITGILLDTRGSENYFRAFYARRALRIFPLYFAALTIAFVLVPAIGNVPPQIARDQPHQIWLWTYLSNWPEAMGFGSKTFPHFWSLAVEEQFYLLWPLVVYRLTAEKCVRVCAAISIVSLAIRFAMVMSGASHEAIYPNSFCRMDALAMGAALAAALRVPSYRAWLFDRHRFILGATVILGLLWIAITRGYWHTTVFNQSVGYSLLAAVFTLMVAMVAIAAIGEIKVNEATDASRANAQTRMSARVMRVLRSTALRTLGKYSYGMYVIHKPFHDFAGVPLAQMLGLPARQSAAADAIYIAAMLLATMLIAVASYHLFEVHFLRMKQHFAPRFDAH